ncbi:MAG: type I DNA topoisomerase [Nitrospinae bacterium]|nr:type I DNA topoisomerase [Nitrospinota bacterium]
MTDKKNPNRAAPKRAPSRSNTRQPASKLLIVESPTKVRTIQKFLGADFDILASRGHVRDLQKTGERKMGIDVHNDFKADYGVIQGKAKTIDQLRKAATAAKEIYLAPDPDREGEAIAWHIQELLGGSGAENKFYRVTFNEITKRAVQEALSQPGRIDQRKVDAQETRRKLDRIVGFKLSGEILWNKVAFGLSAGRVQSVALKLICEREDAIEAFEPKEYWSITAHLEKAGFEPPFEAKLHRIDGKEAEIPNEARAMELAEKIAAAALRVSRVERKERRRRPPAPFITSTLQQESSGKLRYGAKKTMSIAQSLYEGVNLGREAGNVGLITYMRTDSVRLAPEAVTAARAYIETQYGQDHLPRKPNVFKTRETAQDAHEAIRPTDVGLTPDKVRPYLKPEQFSLYSLIWRRFLASQMAPAVYDQTSVDITPDGQAANVAKDEELLLRASGSVLKFKGFLRVYETNFEPGSDADTPKTKPSNSEQDRLLPPLEDGDPLSFIKSESAPTGVAAEQHFTQPPPRYTEASLVKELEEDGVGRPSTYASILDTLEKRKYVTIERRRRQFTPSSLGREVNRLLIQGFPDQIDVGFTAKMEKYLDDIEKGTTPWLPVMRDFYDSFDQKIQTAKKELPNLKTKGEPIGRNCPECERELVKKFSRNGWFISCSGYPSCRYSENIPTEGEPEPEAAEELARIEELAQPCEECGAPMQAKRGPFGLYLSCTAFPDAHKKRKALGNGQAAAAPKSTGVSCPTEGCDGELVERRSRRTGKPFYGCSRFPACKTVAWDWPVAQPCPSCGHPILTVKTTKRNGNRLVCPQKECGYAVECPPELIERMEASKTTPAQEASA